MDLLLDPPGSLAAAARDRWGTGAGYRSATQRADAHLRRGFPSGGPARQLIRRRLVSGGLIYVQGLVVVGGKQPQDNEPLHHPDEVWQDCDEHDGAHAHGTVTEGDSHPRPPIADATVLEPNQCGTDSGHGHPDKEHAGVSWPVAVVERVSVRGIAPYRTEGEHVTREGQGA